MSLGAKMLNQSQLVSTPLWSSTLASCSINNKFPLQITCITIIFIFTTMEFEGYYNTCLKCPPSKCMHVASHVFKCCQCMHPNLFLIPTADSFMVSGKWCPPPGLQPSQSQIMQPHRKKPNGLQACGWVGQSIFLHNFCSIIHHFSAKM